MVVVHLILRLYGLVRMIETWCQDEEVPWEIAEALRGYALPKTTRAYARSDMAGPKRLSALFWRSGLSSWLGRKRLRRQHSHSV